MVQFANDHFLPTRQAKLIVLDRDGVINYDSDQFIKSPDEWRPIPGSLASSVTRSSIAPTVRGPE